MFTEFNRFLVIRFLLTFVLMIENVLLGYFIYTITKDPMTLGFVGLAEAIPAIGFALYAGHIVDKSDKRNVLMLCYITFIISTILCYIVIQKYIVHDISAQLCVLFIYISIFISGIARSFAPPAGFSMLSMLVQKIDIPKASAKSSMAWQAGAVLGPTISGLLYNQIGILLTLQLVILGLIICFILIQTIKKKPPIGIENQQESVFERINQGIHFVFKHPIILPSLSLDLFSVLFGGVTAILPVFADDILHVGATGLGYMRAAPGIGSIIILLYLSRYPIRKKLGLKLFASVALFGICCLLFGLSNSFKISLLLLFFSGVFDGVSVATRSILLQTHTPDIMRGRVSAVNNMFISSSNEIGAAESGFAAKYLGTIPSVVFGGCATLFVVIVVFLKAKTLRNLEH